MDDLVAAVRTGLAELGDPARATAQQRYMKSAMPFRGVAVPIVRSLCGRLASDLPWPDRATWEATVRDLWDGARFREERYAALGLARHRHAHSFQDPDTLPLYRHMVVTGAWWDLVDETAAHLVGPIRLAAPDAVAPLLREWAGDTDMWLRRAAILAQLSAKSATDVELLDHVLTVNLADGERFVRKAIGWALREHARTDPAWVIAYVAGHEMSGLSRREALRHLVAE